MSEQTTAITKIDWNQSANQNRGSALRSLADNESALARLTNVLPDGLDARRVMNTAANVVLRNDYLAQSTMVSVFNAVVEAAELGLMVGSGVAAEAYLVPFRNRNNGNRQEAQLIPGYRGLIKLAEQSGVVRDVQAFVVYAGEDFDWQPGELPNHRPDLTLDIEKAELVAAYAIVTFRDGGHRRADVMRASEILKIKRDALRKTKGKGPWVDHEAEMWKKTTIRRACKTLPLSADDKLLRALELEDRLHDIEVATRDVGGVADLKRRLLPDRPGDVIDVDDADVNADPDGVVEGEEVDEPGGEGLAGTGGGIGKPGIPV
ncbi:MAG: recombinase RecT [Planctomycetota bacterium]